MYTLRRVFISVLSMNGNRWVGPDHNAVITDGAGQDWFVYHAVDRNDPYFAGEVGFTKRPALLDRLDWIDGWPTVRTGRWASSSPQPVPVVAVKGDQDKKDKDKEDREPSKLPFDQPGKLLSEYSDEFDGSALSQRWSWVRQPAPETMFTSIASIRRKGTMRIVSGRDGSIERI